MTDEPFGHRGHPSEREFRRADKLRVYVERAIARLVKQGFDEAEAVVWIASVAYTRAEEAGETWTSRQGAIRTVEAVRDGRGAKEWSASAVILALYDIGDLL